MGEVRTIDKVIEIVSDLLDVGSDKELTESTSIVDDLGADSLEVMELVMKMEEEFGIDMPEEEVSKLKTIGDIVDVIEDKVAHND